MAKIESRRGRWRMGTGKRRSSGLSGALPLGADRLVGFFARVHPLSSGVVLPSSTPLVVLNDQQL